MFSFSIAAVDNVIFEGEVVSVIAPGSAGEFTILAHHAPFVTTLKKGTVKVRDKKGGGLQEFEISGGLLETSGNRAIILV